MTSVKGMVRKTLFKAEGQGMATGTGTGAMGSCSGEK